MVSIPTYLLRNLYLKGSLRNIEGGFEFAMRNNLYPGTLTALVKLEVDGEEVSPDRVLVGKGEPLRKASEMAGQPVHFNVGDTLLIRVLGKQLAAGEHKINIVVNALEAGHLSIPLVVTV